jgi:MFS family permease
MLYVASLVIRLIAGKASDKYGRVIVLIWSSLTMIISMVLLSLAHSVTMVIISASILGFSVGMNGPTLMAWTVDLCKPENRGRAVASVYIALEVGIGLGAIISGWIYQNKLSNLPYAFLLTGALALIAMLLLMSWNKKEKRRKMQKEEAIYDFSEYKPCPCALVCRFVFHTKRQSTVWFTDVLNTLK